MFSIFWPFKLAGGLIRFVINVFVLLSCVLTLMAFMGDRGWVWSLTTHFHVQYLAVQLTAFFLASIAYFSDRRRENPDGPRGAERWLSLVFLGFFAGVNLMCVAPYYAPPPRPDAPLGASRLKLLHMNLFGLANRHFNWAAALIRREKPDMVDLVEYNEDWRRRLEAEGVFQAYPYRVTGKGHIALYSKRPLRNGRVSYAGAHQVANQANIIAQFSMDGEPITILVAHPASPIQPSHLDWLKESFATWEQERRKLGRNLILVGDLNTSPWSVEFNTLTQKADLRDSQLGYGLQPSWPMLLPILGIREQPNWLTRMLQVPIDHVLVSDRIAVLSRQTGPFVGSDHLPVVAEVAVAPSGGNASRKNP